MCVLLLGTVSISEKRDDGKMSRNMHRMDRMDVKIRVR
jgi:hypothetical protein